MDRLGQLDSVTHKILWICLLFIGAIILMWPVSPTPYDPLPMQSLYAVQHLPWFVVFFYAWGSIFAALLFGAKGSRLERLVLCLVFTMVFVEFWGFASPLGNHSDSTWFLAHVDYLDKAGKIPSEGHPVLRYFDFPGFPLLGVAITELTGSNIFTASAAYLLVGGAVFSLIVYSAFLKILGGPDRAARAFVLALSSSTVLSTILNQFHAINLATLYIATFFLLLPNFALEEGRVQQIIPVFLLLTLAAATEYLFSPVFFSMVLLAIFLLSQVSNERRSVSLHNALFPLIALLVWETYATAHNFLDTFGQLSKTVQNLLNMGWMIPVQQLLIANLGPAYPWWGNVVRLFWWSSVFGAGTLLMFWKVFSFRRSDRAQITQLSAFLGSMFTVAIGFFSIPIIGVVHGGLSRYLWVGPLVIAPVLVEALSRPRLRVVAVSFVLASFVLLVPTFFVSAHSFSKNRVYRSEVAVSQFLGTVSDGGRRQTLYALPTFPTALYIYAPDAEPRAANYIYGLSQGDAWALLDRIVADFHSENNEKTLAITSAKAKAEYQEMLGVPADHPRWRSLDEQLSAVARVYDSDFFGIYAR